MIPVEHHTYAQTHKPRWKVIYACFCIMLYIGLSMKRASSWDYGTSRTCNQRRLRRACTSAQSSAQSCQGHKCSHTRNVDEGACLKLGSPQQLLAKWSKKPLVYRPCIFKFATSLFYPLFREKLFSMQTTKAQISQRTCAVLPIISRKYDS